MRRRLPYLLVALFVGLTALGPGGCAGTGGELVEIELAFVGGTGGVEGGGLGTGQTRYDPSWAIELSEARLVVGAAYVFPPTRITDIGHILSPAKAYAHAGDDNLFAVNALAEYREQFVVDALSPEPLVFGPLLAEAGEAAEVSVWIDAPRGELSGPSGPTHGYHAWIRGVARQGDREVPFEAGLTLEDTPLQQRVDNIAIRGDGEVTAGSRVLIEVLAGTWLGQVDFDGMLADGSLTLGEDGVARPTAPHVFQQAWRIDFHDRDAFTATVEGGER